MLRANVQCLEPMFSRGLFEIKDLMNNEAFVLIE